MKKAYKFRYGASQKSGLNKSIVDAGWRRFVQYCFYKAENAGGKVVQVNPKNTSQICSNCHHKQTKKLTLEDRVFHCEKCNFVCDRDKNAALNILELGLSFQKTLVHV